MESNVRLVPRGHYLDGTPRYLTVVSGQANPEQLLRQFKHTLNCNGTVVGSTGEIQLQGNRVAVLAAHFGIQ